MNTTIMLFLIQDGITNGAIYALLGLALVLVFAVTRVILIPQGEFVTYGALTYASLSSGQMPGTARLAVAMGLVAFCLDLFAARRSLGLRRVTARNPPRPTESRSRSCTRIPPDTERKVRPGVAGSGIPSVTRSRTLALPERIAIAPSSACGAITTSTKIRPIASAEPSAERWQSG